MRHKTIQVDFVNKKVMAVHEIEFVPVMETFKNGISKIFGKAIQPLMPEQKVDQVALDEVNKALSGLKDALKKADEAMANAGYFTLTSYNTRNKRFGEEVVDTASKLRLVEAIVKDQADFLEEIVADKYGITIKK